MKDWKLIFNTNSYYYILIEETNKDKYLNFYWKHQSEIESIDSFFFIMPTKEDIEKNDFNSYVVRFAQLIKDFINDPKKKTLFIEEDILKAIVKEDKRTNFFRYISKSNKNVVVFYHNDIYKYALNSDYTSIKMTEQDLEMQYHLFDRFDDIKDAINKTHNPFKDPINAFNKIKNDNH